MHVKLVTLNDASTVTLPAAPWETAQERAMRKKRRPSGGKAQPVTINGVLYESINAAATAIGVDRKTLQTAVLAGTVDAMLARKRQRETAQ